MVKKSKDDRFRGKDLFVLVGAIRKGNAPESIVMDKQRKNCYNEKKIIEEAGM